ncbi:Borealin N terminal-domain-containing protein [Apodospora peruviana]|uniref:Borealin N terminal-domain-containing protein n=1 Tax=Apodospora peruviana TaxID=516989 RepID=A0AAE0MFP3_9PEZI|nr:Borealin N terminal-domain-containing protein [Apodospora peruviana]
MPPIRGTKRKSVDTEEQNTFDMTTSQRVPTKTNSSGQESPHKKRKTGISLAQKQALIDNLQLEITERARKLRANYSIHAQSLRTRIEIRVNRIPLSLRKARMGDLLQKYSAESQQKSTTNAARGPPVPEKDGQHAALSRYPFPRPGVLGAIASPARLAKRLSQDISGGDKENEVEHVENAKKKSRLLGPAAEIARNPGQVLSPTSSNSRIAPRGGGGVTSSPGKSGIARPVSPIKTAGIISNMVEKARSTRTGAVAAATKDTRKTTPSTTAATATAATRATRTRANTGASQQSQRPATRTARRVSANSESSEGSTSTVVRKRPGTAMSGTTTSKAAAAAPPKRNVMSTIKKGVTGATVKKTATKAAATPASTSSTGRVLRKRG